MVNKTTLKDVAKMAGVSSAAVSYTLSGKRTISEETKKRVFDAIEKLDYVPDLNAQSLSTRDSKLIGVVVPMYLAECLDNERRGSGTAMFQLILTLGMVFAAVIGLIVTSLVGPAYTPEAGTKIDIATLDL